MILKGMSFFQNGNVENVKCDIRRLNVNKTVLIAKKPLFKTFDYF